MKKDLIIFIMLILVVTNVFGQCDCTALIDPSYEDLIKIFDRPNGRKVDEIRNDLKGEDFLVLTILEDSGDFFKVSMKFSIKSMVVTGWIMKAPYIGTFGNNYDDRDIDLHSVPSSEGKVESTVTTWSNGLYTIKRCKGKWIYVRTLHKNIVKEGWMNPNDQCSNPYSTCG